MRATSTMRASCRVRGRGHGPLLQRMCLHWTSSKTCRSAPCARPPPCARHAACTVAGMARSYGGDVCTVAGMARSYSGGVCTVAGMARSYWGNATANTSS